MAKPFLSTSRVRYDIDQKAIGSFTRSAHGMVTRWNLKVTNEVKAEAAARTLAGTTKYGSSLLARSFTVVLASTGETHCEVHVKNKQPYAKFVFLGTGPMIGSGHGLMPVGKSQFRGLGKFRVPNGFEGRPPHRTAITPRLYVRGQQAHNYPVVAMRLVLQRHRIFLGAGAAG